MSVWDDLSDGRIGDVDFPIASRNVSGGRDFARFRYPYKAGQDVEDTGRKPRTFQLTIEFFADVDPEHYPARYEELIALLESEDDKGELEYLDPVYGPLQVKVVDWSAQEEAQARDGATVQLTLEEIADEPTSFIIQAPNDPRAEAEELSLALDAGLEEAGITNDDLAASFDAGGVALTGDELSFPAGEFFISATDGFFDAMEEAALAADEIAVHVDRYRSRVDRLLAFDAMKEVERWSIVESAIRLGDTIAQAGETKVSTSVPVIEWPVPVVMSAYEIALVLYGDETRSGEITQRNPVKNPLFYPVGKVLRVLER